MEKDIVQIVARNVMAAFKKRGYRSYRQLAGNAKVAPNSVKNLMYPQERAPNTRGDASPRLDVLDKISSSMGYPTWVLLLEDFDPEKEYVRPITKCEDEAYKMIQSAYERLPKPSLPGEPPIDGKGAA